MGVAMSVLLEREISNLKSMVSSLGAHVEQNVERSVRAVHERDEELAQSVIDSDPDVDAMEVNIEEECLKVLALHQPVANDIRFIVSALKVNNDLERIGDRAANIAEQGRFIARHGPATVPYDLLGMATKVRKMLRDSLDALMGTDARIAQTVREADDEVDAMDRLMYPGVRAAIRETPEMMEGLIRLLRVSQNLERIADHATNIAEDVIYLAEGEIVRHTSQDDGSSAGS
jgi:phosphate transport system protein